MRFGVIHLVTWHELPVAFGKPNYAGERQSMTQEGRKPRGKLVAWIVTLLGILLIGGVACRGSSIHDRNRSRNTPLTAGFRKLRTDRFRRFRWATAASNSRCIA